jgi:hypothetical protein
MRAKMPYSHGEASPLAQDMQDISTNDALKINLGMVPPTGLEPVTPALRRQLTLVRKTLVFCQICVKGCREFR